MAEANIVTIPDDIIEYRTNKREKRIFQNRSLFNLLTEDRQNIDDVLLAAQILTAKIPIQQAFEGTEKYATQIGGVKMMSKENCPLRVEKQQKLKKGYAMWLD